MEKQEFFTYLDKSIGNKVDIVNKSGINKGIYSSSILDLKNGVIGLAQPMYKGTLVQISGMEVTIYVKSGDSLLEAPVVSRGTTFEGKVPILWVEPIGDINRVQRRSYVRIPCFLEASCCFLEIYSDVYEPEPELGFIKEWFPVYISNISLGGVAVKIKPEFEPNFHNKGRYLLAVNFGDGLMFINLLLRNTFNNSDDNMPIGAFAFGGLSIYQDRVIGNYVRRQELIVKQTV